MAEPNKEDDSNLINTGILVEPIWEEKGA